MNATTNAKETERCEEVYNVDKNTALRCEAYSPDDHVHAATIPTALLGKYAGRTAIRWQKPRAPKPDPVRSPDNDILPAQ